MSVRIVILAAGQGTRMNSDLAKVLHRLGDKTLLDHVLSTAAQLSAEKTVVIVGHQHERVRAEHSRWGVEFVQQVPQRGTGHAVQQAEAFLRGHRGATLILYGDVPLLRRATLLELLEEHRHARNAATVLTARVPDPSGYGRIRRDPDGRLQAIVEDRDLRPEQRSIDEINSGIYVFSTPDLLESLAGLRDDNDQGELYLTDTVQALHSRGLRVGTHTVADPLEISGINTPAQLASAEALLAKRKGEGSEDCLVCTMARGGVGFPVLLTRKHAVLTVAGRPYNSGQVTSHPLRHMMRHAELTDTERRDLWDLGLIAASAVQDIYHPQGMNIGYGAGRPGHHLALEVIPRWVGDTNFMPLLAETTLLPESPQRTFLRIRDLLSERGIS